MGTIVNANAKSIDELATEPSRDTAQRERQDFEGEKIGAW
jgi:hypothetical protein